MKIALTADPEIPVPPRLYGGIERVIDMLARELQQRGHDVTLFAHPESSCPVAQCPWPGRSSGSRVDGLRNTVALASRVMHGRFDLVHSFSRLAYMTPILPLKIPKLMSYQRAISPHTTQRAHRMSRGTLTFSAISQQMIEPVRAIGSWHIVPNGVSLGVYDARLTVAPDAPLMFLGRIEEIKGPHLAIEAARRAGRRLVIAGNIPDSHHGWFDQAVAPHIDGVTVSYVGPVDDARKNALLGQSCAMLMPILWEEPFGIVMAEAMACGTPVIGFRRGSVPEVVAHGETGYVIDTVDEMVEAIGQIPTISRAACRRRVEDVYSAAAVTDGYIALYEAMLGREGSASP